MKNILKQIVFAAFFIACVSGWFYFGNSTASADSKKTGAATLYKTNCASCHGKDGRAKSFRGKFTNAQDLTDSAWQADEMDEDIFRAISNGRKKMPAFGKKLSEKEINSLVDYVRNLKK
ncbi:MAG: c-type cytochrome [Pyrinomonadaceae bacterium]